ncbi:MAG TPA: XRE family transcriptional regulator [Nitrospirae bacterium]|nr:anaerobic benzoate catabolism transcriptional regulator [bacterium BMS3Abin10]GBE39295.1 anaerobic benzoate catabolism transcriptional regulator [bacterium BMS3Bbin08]HDK17195.1 XRE family transcriptional regulator [Nitrospirota bacterium]HDK82144.1 XRE family transcriptional regulator [Nitrospirota bacterium]
MITFGDNVLLWRLHRSLSQEQLAARANIPRPNLSSIERGKRSVTLSTIRSLANALDVPPGTLVNGEPPGHKKYKSDFTREAMERVARSVVQGVPPKDPSEHQIYDLLKQVLQCGLQSVRAHHRKLPLPTRRSARAWLYLRALCSTETINSLIARSVEQAEIKWIDDK